MESWLIFEQREEYCNYQLIVTVDAPTKELALRAANLDPTGFYAVCPESAWTDQLTGQAVAAA